jgi:hypothetical protein
LSICFLLFISPTLSFSQNNCNTPGTILSGFNTVLNPDNNGFFSASGSGFTRTTEEYLDFESPDGLGVGGANRGWTPIIGTEPTGLNEAGDVGAGGNCSNTDITTDANGGNDYAYYSVIDPDNISDNGNERLAFAIRIADKINGAFTFSFLVDADNNCGSDPNAVCGNPCFEYEIQLNTQQGEVNIISIDGCAGTPDCDGLNAAATPNGTDAFVCQDCTGADEALQVCAGSSECVGNEPVFWIFYVNFSDLPGLNSTSTFTLVPATTTSPNSVIYKNTNVSDYGGIGDPNDPADCDCATSCLGSTCSDCIADCALSCAGEKNVVTFPVEFASFEGAWDQAQVVLHWTTTSELNNSHFVVEHAADGRSFSAIGQVQGVGTTLEKQSYRFAHSEALASQNFYRLKQVDFNGEFSYSNTIELKQNLQVSSAKILGNPVKETLTLQMYAIPVEGAIVSIHSLTGQVLAEEKVSQEAGQMTIKIPVQHLARGIYFLRVQSDPETVVLVDKFIKS